MKKFDYMTNLVPTLWDPGHMGTFLLRVLVNPYIKDASPQVLKQFDCSPAFEWKVEDRIGSYFGMIDANKKSDYKDVYQVLMDQNLSEAEFELTMAHILLQVSANEFTRESFFTRTSYVDWKLNLSREEILKLINNDSFVDDRCVFPYIKSHLSMYTRILKDISFNRIIWARFPENKEWLAELLLFYKHFYFWVGKKHHWIKFFSHYKKPVRDQIVNRFLNIVEDSTQSDFIPVKTWNNILSPEVDIYKKMVIVDMYDLIFNKNTQQLKDFYPDHNDPSLRALLDLVEGHTRQICRLFNFEPEMNFSLGDSKKPLRTTKVLEACNEVKDYCNSLFTE